MLTLKLKVWSAPAIVDGDGEEFAIPDDLLRKKMMKLSRFLAPLDACLRPDAPLDETLLLDQATSSGVAPVDGFVFNSGDSEWIVARDRERLRGIEVAEVNKACTVVLSIYL
jgi:hypothetical protein